MQKEGVYRLVVQQEGLQTARGRLQAVVLSGQLATVGADDLNNSGELVNE